MKISDAATAYSQSDKVKSGLIWLTQLLEIWAGFSDRDRRGAEKIIGAAMEMVAYECHLSRRLTGDEAWVQVEKHVDMALVMIRSGVPQECAFHFTRALSHVTGIGQRAMEFLKKEGKA